MGMLPKVRGRGLGSLLLSHLVEWAVSVPQIEKVKLGVLSNNLRAIGLYEKHGFREEGRLWRDVKYADGSYADLVLMARFV